MLDSLLGPQYSTTRLGWLTTRVANPSLEQARGLVFLFRGTGAWFSPGFGTLADRLRSEGFWVEDLRSVGDGWACRWLMAKQLRLPIILAGHSRGGRRALLAASRLQHAGIPVEMLMLHRRRLPATGAWQCSPSGSLVSLPLATLSCPTTATRTRLHREHREHRSRPTRFTHSRTVVTPSEHQRFGEGAWLGGEGSSNYHLAQAGGGLVRLSRTPSGPKTSSHTQAAIHFAWSPPRLEEPGAK
jgi:hypothetical protein